MAGDQKHGDKVGQRTARGYKDKFSHHDKNVNDKLDPNGHDAKHFMRNYVGFDFENFHAMMDGDADFSSAHTEELLAGL